MPKKVIHTDRLMRPIAHFSHAARIGDVVHVGATAGVHADLRLAGDSPGRIDTAAQIRKMFENLDTALGLIGASTSDVVRIKTYLAFPRDVAVYRPIFDRLFSGRKPAHAVVGSWDFPLPQAAVELDAVAVVGGFTTDDTGGITADGFHYATATPVDGKGQTVGFGNTREQTSAALRNLQATLAAAGLRPGEVCYLHLTLRDIREHADVVSVLIEFFGARLPAWTVVGAPLERADFAVSIESFAAKGGGDVVESGAASVRPGRSAPAILSGDVLFLGGQLGLREDADRALDVREQTELAWERLHSLVAAAGFGDDTIIRTNNILTDWRDYAGFNAGYGKNVREPYVPRATVLGDLTASGARVQIEGIAHRRGADATILQVPPPAGK
jgi:enamine deaminase RidA (YjgF/YER057c/UK114 family)